MPKMDDEQWLVEESRRQTVTKLKNLLFAIPLSFVAFNVVAFYPARILPAHLRKRETWNKWTIIDCVIKFILAIKRLAHNRLKAWDTNDE